MHIVIHFVLNSQKTEVRNIHSYQITNEMIPAKIEQDTGCMISVVIWYEIHYILGYEQMLIFNIRTFSNFHFQIFECLTLTQ